jgi:hypothetical protein
MTWSPGHRYAAGLSPSGSSTLTTLGTSRGPQESYVELIRGTVTVPAGAYVLTVTTTAVAALSVEGVSILTVTNGYDSAVFGVFNTTTNRSVELLVTSRNGVVHSAYVTWSSVPLTSDHNNTVIGADDAVPQGQPECSGYTDCARCSLDTRCAAVLPCRLAAS